MTGDGPVIPGGNALVIEPPAVKLKLPEDLIVPELMMLFKAMRLRLKVEVTRPLLKILLADILAEEIVGLREITSMVPALLKLPVRFSATDLSTTVTPEGITKPLIYLLALAPKVRVPPVALPKAPRRIDCCPLETT